MIAVIVPFSRAAMFAGAVTNFLRQEYPHKRLVVVQNGAGRGCVWPEGTVVLEGEEHPARARNTGIDWAEARGYPWVTMDDDDWYGREYLGEFAAAFSEGVQLAGKTRAYMQMPDGIYYNPKGVWFTGGAMGCARPGLRFPDVRLGEDAALHQLALQRGYRVRRLSDQQYIYRRDHCHPHAWSAPADVIMLRATPGDWAYLGTDPEVATRDPIPERVRAAPTDEEVFAAIGGLP